MQAVNKDILKVALKNATVNLRERSTQYKNENQVRCSAARVSEVTQLVVLATLIHK